MDQVFLTLSEASHWATDFLKKNVTPSNISYLIQYGRVRKYTQDGITKVSREELETYYDRYVGARQSEWASKLGEEVNWTLAFDSLKEAETTKHVHRLHPYKGKYIPQLVEYFLDTHQDEFKREVYFRPGDVILDPFCGSGTTLVQSNELGIHAVGVDVSPFNALISNVKIRKHNLLDLQQTIQRITSKLRAFVSESPIQEFERNLTDSLNQFNLEHFPPHEFKYQVRQGLINQDEYGLEKQQIFQPVYDELVRTYQVEITQSAGNRFLDIWYLQPVRREIDFIIGLVEQIPNPQTKQVVQIILSRTIRSCRATTHADLGTLLEPVTSVYYCAKHGKVCKPLFSLLSWWERYSKDTLTRLSTFDRLRTPTHQHCLVGDSRTIQLTTELIPQHLDLANLLTNQKIKGIFSSPPYLGLIDYHEQHAYAYELFSFERYDNLEIGAMFNGQSKDAKQAYVMGIADVLHNAQAFMAIDYDVFLVANDKFNLYPQIAERAGMTIVNQFKRPVLNRTERDRLVYSETIFHLKAR